MGVTLLATTRVIVAVVIHVPGPAAPAARFGLPSVGLQQHRRQVFTIPIDDAGNMLMKPYLAANLRPCAGGPVVLSLVRQLDTFVPHTSIDYPWYLNSLALPAGCYEPASPSAAPGWPATPVLCRWELQQPTFSAHLGKVAFRGQACRPG
jgi:hypothetical protein